MANSILNNVAALGATRQVGLAEIGLRKTIERLTTGKRINRASDDASGLATANTLAADVRIAAANKRIYNDSVTSNQTQDGYLEEATNLLLRATELAAAGSGTAELNLISTTVTSIISTASSFSGGTSVTITALSGTGTAAISTTLASVASARGTIGASQMIAQSNANLQGILEENKTAQMSQIMDADIGAEVVALSKWQILQQSSVSALAQANQAGQSVLALLR